MRFCYKFQSVFIAFICGVLFLAIIETASERMENPAGFLILVVLFLVALSGAFLPDIRNGGH